MKRIENRYVLSVIYALLTVYALFSVIPFFWTTIQSFKTPRQANSRVPLFIFEPTADNYTDLWLRSIPDDPMLVAAALIVIFGLLGFVGMQARRFPVPRGYVYIGILAIGYAVLWSIPGYVRTQTFYDYFLNTIIVTTGTICISISIGCLAGLWTGALQRHRRRDHPGDRPGISLLAGYGVHFAILVVRSTLGPVADTHFLLIITLVAINQPFTIWMLRSFFMNIPKEIEESAMVDGANRLTAFLSVIIPIMWPGIISTALFTLLLAYSDFLLVRILTQCELDAHSRHFQVCGGRRSGAYHLGRGGGRFRSGADHHRGFHLPEPTGEGLDLGRGKGVSGQYGASATKLMAAVISDLRGSDTREYSRYRIVIAVLILLAHASIGLNFFGVTPLLPLVIDDYEITRASASLLVALPTLVKACIGLPGSLIINRFGLNRVFTLSWFMLGMLALSPWIQDFYLMLLLRLVYGIGAGLMMTATASLIMQWFRPNEVPIINTLLLIVISLGIAISITLAAPLGGAHLLGRGAGHLRRLRLMWRLCLEVLRSHGDRRIFEKLRRSSRCGRSGRSFVIERSSCWWSAMRWSSSIMPR